MSNESAAQVLAPIESPPVVSGPGSILAVIERVAKDQNADIEKMERLMQMHERLLEREAVAAYTEAMAQMQSALPSIVERGSIKDRNGNTQSTYALWEDINAAIKPVLQKYGFALSFRTETQKDAVRVTGVLAHRCGHRESTEITLPADTSGSKNSVQSVGSSVSYGKRYAAGALLNITTHGEDDDGRLGGGKLEARAIDWIDEANELEDAEKYADLRERVMADYDGKASSIPREVRAALSRAKSRVMPKD